MKQLLYVYIPGFEYDSVGPLHIDALKLDVKVAADDTSTSGNSNALTTYCYISDDIKLEGNLLYRIEPSEELPSGYYTGTKGISPNWTELEDNGRAPFGMFYDFVTNNDSTKKYHHVIGIHNTVDNCRERSKNLDVDEHDGLFLVEIELLNVDLVLTFTFYSKIGNSDLLTNPIELSVPGKSFKNNSNDFRTQHTYSESIMSEYVEVGTWTQTYNPATSGIEEGTQTPAGFVNQYFNLRSWGTEDIPWEIPVNAGMLVTDMSNQHAVIQTSNKDLYMQYSYDRETLKHKLDENLACNRELYELLGAQTFYTNFYEGFSDRFSSASTLGTAADFTASRENYTKPHFENSAAAASGDGFKSAAVCGITGNSMYYNRNYFCWNDFCFKGKTSHSYSYKLSCLDIESLSYLYTKLPQVAVKNLATTGNFGDPNWDTAVLFSANTHTRRAGATLGTQQTGIYNLKLPQSIDSGHYNNAAAATNRWYAIVTKGEGVEPSSSEVSQWRSEDNVPNLKAECYYKTPADYSEKLVFSSGTINLNKEATSSWYRNHISSSLKTYATSSESTDGAAHISIDVTKNYYYNGIERSSFIYPTVMSESEQIVSLADQNLLKFRIDLSNYKFPALLFGGSFSNENAHGSTIRPWLKPYTENRIPKWSNYTLETSDHKNYTFDFANYYNTYHIGRLHLGVHQMLQIDLSESDIEYHNLAQHSICPYITYGNMGYILNGDSAIPANVLENSQNLLVDDIGNDPELVKLCGDDECDEVTKLKFNTGTLFDSTFCNDKRFIGVSTSNLNTTREIQFTNVQKELDEGFYVLRVQTLYPAENGEITISCSLDGINKELNSSKNVFFVNNNASFALTKLTINLEHQDGHTTYYNVVSGIGLYKVNTEDLTNPYNNLLMGLKPGQTEFFEHGDNDNVYNCVIFPAIFCAQENAVVGKRLFGYRNPRITTSETRRSPSRLGGNLPGINPDINPDVNNKVSNSSAEGYRYKEAYDNDYCSTLADDPIMHFYNFSYLPEKAVYEVQAFYKIPTGNNKIPNEIYSWDNPGTNAISNKRFTQIKNTQIRS